MVEVYDYNNGVLVTVDKARHFAGRLHGEIGKLEEIGSWK